MKRVRVIGILVLFIICYLLFIIPPMPSFAATSDILTKKEAIMRLSASNTVKKKVADLFSWNGYDLSKIRQAIPTPLIKNINLIPDKIPLDGTIAFEIAAKVEDPSGPENIASVRANLSAVGGLANVIMVDNGLYGDKNAFDQIYTLQTKMMHKLDAGQKEIAISATNKDGWIALAKATLEITKNPNIIK